MNAIANPRQWNGRQPPDYVSVWAWRQKRLLAIRNSPLNAKTNRPVLLEGAEAYYAENPADFISHWCDTVDPRRTGTDTPARVPFVLFPRQSELAQFLHELVKAQANGLIEKCRDMGATWDAAAFSCWAWRFMEGASIGWGSRKAELVDRIGDMDSIFEKLRATIDSWPREFWPKGYDPDRHASYMKIINPENGNTITGESGDEIGRGGRKLIYFKDESAHYERPEKIEAALGDNTNTQVDISSVNGLGNVFHRRREAGIIWEPGMQMERGKTYVFIMDWTDHPQKTQEWYDERHDKAEDEGLIHVFEQEVNRNYSAAVQGVIIPAKWVRACRDAHLVIPGMEEGNWMASLDPADGPDGDKNAAGARKGLVLKRAKHWGEQDAGVATRNTVSWLRELGARMLVMYDSVGVGASVTSEVNRLKALPDTDADKMPKTLTFVAWNAGAGVLDPDEPISSAVDPGTKKKDANATTNKEQFMNFKAQAWWALRTRCEKTYKAIAAIGKGEPCPYPVDDLCSWDSESLGLAVTQQLEKELSQPVRKQNTVSTKMVVDKKPAGTRSPNLADMTVMAYFPAPTEGYDLAAAL